MVKLTVKHGDDVQFLFETKIDIDVDELLKDLVSIYNGRLKIFRVCAEIEELAKHGTFLPPNMIGLTDDQIEELHLKDEWATKCIPSGGSQFNRDPIGRRNGNSPNEKMSELLLKTVNETKGMISKKIVANDKSLTYSDIMRTLEILRGAITIIYPMGLPPHDPVQLEFENQEDLTGTQASLDIIPETESTLWWAGKEIVRGKKLQDFIGKNDKTKIVAKLQKKGKGAPAREPALSEEERKKIMLMQYRRQEELKKLEASEDDSFLDSKWADNKALQKSFLGMQDVKWKPF